MKAGRSPAQDLWQKFVAEANGFETVKAHLRAELWPQQALSLESVMIEVQEWRQGIPTCWLSLSLQLSMHIYIYNI